MEIFVDTIYSVCPVVYVPYILLILAGLRGNVAEIRPWPWNEKELVFMDFNVKKIIKICSTY